MTRRDTATRLLVLRVLRDRIAAADKDARTIAGTDFDVPGVRDIGLVGGEPIGSVQLIKGRTTPTVTDPDALLAWVRANHPDEVETTVRVRPSYVAALLGQAKDDGEAVDHATGEAIPGIDVRQSEPSLNVRPSEDAADTIARAMADGSLSLTDITTPAIEARP